MNPFVPEDVGIIREGRSEFQGSLLFADISGFTDLTGRLALHGKAGTEELSFILGNFFSTMYGIIRQYNGSILISAGDSILVRFPVGVNAGDCADRMMRGMGEFGSLKTIAGIASLDMKIVIGAGCWSQFILGDEKDAYVFLAGDLVGKLAEAEESAERGQIVTVESQEGTGCNPLETEHIPDEAFYFTDTVDITGEHRSVTAMFIDVTGYDPSDPPLEELQYLYCQVAAAVARNRGSLQMVDSIMTGGCRIFLLFGAPRSYGDDAIRAVRTGLEIMNSMRRLSTLKLRIGMDEGYAYSGIIGNDWRRNYTVFGDVINRASRIADSIPEWELAVSEKVFRISRNRFIYNDIPDVPIRGSSKSVRLFTPVSYRTEPVYSYEFVGREAEIQRLLQSIGEGGTATVLIGEAGIGKTRLLSRLSDILSEKGIDVISGSALENEVTNGIFASIVADMTGMVDGDSGAVKKSKLWYFINERENSTGVLSRREPFLGSMLFSLEYPGSDYQSLPPRLRRENLLDGICDLLLSYHDGACVILDDLQNCSDEDLEAVEYICRKTMEHGGSRVSFVLASRPDDRSLLLSSGTETDRMILTDLSDAAVERLMLEVLQGIPMEEELEKFVRGRAEGNPFYLMQFILYLLEEGLVSRIGDRWERNEQFSDERLPGNVFSMVMARIDRLEKRAKESLRIGSVMGLRFDEKVVQSIAGAEVHSSLEECNQAGLTYRSELSSLEYVFSHTLIKDVTYDSILRRRRREIHRSIGEILEASNRLQLEHLSPVLANHFTVAGVWHKAVDYSIMAGKRAYSEYRNRDAVQRYRNAVALMKDHPDETPERLPECYREMGRTLDRLGEYAEALECYDLGIRLSSDIRMKAETTMLKGDILYTQGQVEESLDMLDSLERELDSHSGDGLSESCYRSFMVRIECFRSWSYCVMGKNDDAMAKALRAVELARDLGDVSEGERGHRLGYAYNTLATVHWGNGDFNQALEYYKSAQEIARKQNLKREMAVTSGNMGLVYLKLGNIQEALDSFINQRTISAEIGDKLTELSSIGFISNSYATTGQFEVALNSSETYCRLAEALPAMHDIIIAHIDIGRISMVLGNFEKAGEHCEKALELSVEQNFDRERAGALQLKGHILMEEGRDHDAEEALSAAEEIIRGMHAKSQLLDLDISMFFLKVAMGRIDQAGKYLDESRKLMKDMSLVMKSARMLVMEAMYLQAQGKSESALEEILEAAGVFRKLGLKPCLVLSLQLILRILPWADGDSRDLDESDILKEIRSLEQEMGIDSKQRSALLLIV